MTVSQLIEDIKVISVTGPSAGEAATLTLDSREVRPGAVFFAVRGAQSDGHAYISAAVENGAAAVVCEQLPETPAEGVAYILVEDTSAAIGPMAANFYGHPSDKLKLVGVTGTNGKTTTTTLLYDMFRAMGYRAGLISTVVYRIDTEEVPATHTTPDAITLNRMLAQMAERGCDYCFMEVSSHSVVQHRIGGLRFAGGLFTNITHDHLDYHGTFAEYIKAKKAFFDTLPKEAFAVVNADDRNAQVMVQNCRARVKTFALRSMADYRCRIMETHMDGMLLQLDGREVWTGFLGRFNAYNLAGIYAAAVELGADRDEALKVLSGLKAVSGRFEVVRSADGVTAIVDYAHTPDALQNVIDTVNEIRTPEQKFYIVVGCGGNRDAAKRPVMARIAATGGDMAILTSDNPRREDPDAILADMKAGLEPGARALSITDRREAIRAAVALAHGGDIILIAGKGHENYQEINGVKNHFDDKEEVTNLMKR